MLVFFLSVTTLNSQVIERKYPNWFFAQGELKYETVIVIITKPTYSDSITPYLKRMGAFKFLFQGEVELMGKQGYAGDGHGIFWAESEMAERLDTARYFDLLPSIKVADYEIVSDDVIGMLVLNRLEELDPRLKRRERMPSQQPVWTKSIPRDDRYYYAIGVSSGGFYESSAWDKAEKNSRIELAKQKSLMKTKSMQKQSSNGFIQEVGTLDFTVHLNEVQILKRWKDEVMNVYFVLARMPK